jgi:hypothetical protein
MEAMKPDCVSALQRKWPQSLEAEFTTALSPVRFQSDNRVITAFSSGFARNAVWFLCDPDCMAEREGFEPSVQVLATLTHEAPVSYR